MSENDCTRPYWPALYFVDGRHYSISHLLSILTEKEPDHHRKEQESKTRRLKWTIFKHLISRAITHGLGSGTPYLHFRGLSASIHSLVSKLWWVSPYGHPSSASQSLDHLVISIRSVNIEIFPQVN